MEENNAELKVISQRLDQIILTIREGRDDLKSVQRDMATKDMLKEHREYVTAEIKEIKLSLTEQDKVLANQDKALVGVVNEVEKNSTFRSSFIKGRNYVVGALLVGLITISGGIVVREQQSGQAMASSVPVTNVFIKPTIQSVHPPMPDNHN